MNEPYPAKVECPKCGWLELLCRYSSTPSAELLFWKCKRCDFSWKTETKDQPGAKDDGK